MVDVATKPLQPPWSPLCQPCCSTSVAMTVGVLPLFAFEDQLKDNDVLMYSIMYLFIVRLSVRFLQLCPMRTCLLPPYFAQGKFNITLYNSCCVSFLPTIVQIYCLSLFENKPKPDEGGQTWTASPSSLVAAVFTLWQCVKTHFLVVSRPVLRV